MRGRLILIILATLCMVDTAFAGVAILPGQQPAPALQFVPFSEKNPGQQSAPPFVSDEARRLYEFVIQQSTWSNEYYADALRRGGVYSALGHDTFLVLFHDIYLACPGLSRLEHLLEAMPGGETDIVAWRTLGGGRVWALVKEERMTRGIVNESFHALIFWPVANGAPSVTTSPLAFAAYDADMNPAELCGTDSGDPERGIEVATMIHGYSIRDLNGDHLDDISFKVTRQDCTTMRRVNARITYVFSGRGFKELKPRSSGPVSAVR